MTDQPQEAARSAGGRPSLYSPDLAAAICERLVAGESLRAICRDPAMPAISSVFLWMSVHKEFSEQYARARAEQADAKFDELEELAATATPETASVVKLQVDTRKWVLSRMSPKKYGEKVQQEVSGSDGGPVQIQVVTGVPRADTSN